MKITGSEHADLAKSKDLAQRIATAVWGIPLLVGIIWYGGLPLKLLVLALSGIACWEYRGLVLRKVGDPSSLGLFGGMLVLFASLGTGNLPFSVAIALLVLLNFALAVRRYKKGSPLANAGYAMGGALYVSMFNFLILLRDLPAAWGNFALYGLFLTWATDVAAYFIGVRWGKTPLAPNLSPKKSKEGSVAGLVGSAIAGAAFGTWFGWPLIWGGIIGLLIGLAAQVGDLAESALKRDAGVKDAGKILPGHGGVLDRFDSLLFVAPVLYLLIGLLA